MKVLQKKGIELLRWSEKYTKTDMVYLFKSSFWVFFGQFATAGSAFILVIVLANILDKEVFGTYRYVLSFVSLFVIFSLTGLGTAVTQTVARGFSGELRKVPRVRMLWALLATMAMFVVGGYYFLNDNQSLGIIFFISGLIMPIYDVFFSYFFFLQGKQNFELAAKTQAISRSVLVLGMITTALLTQSVLILVLVFMLITAGSQFVAHRYVLQRNKEDDLLGQDPDLYKYGKKLSFLASFSIIAVQIDKILVGAFLGVEAVAIYVLALMLPQESKRLGRLFYQIYLPKFSRIKKGEKIAVLVKNIGLLTIVVTIIWFVYAAFAPLFFGIILPEYQEIIPYTQVAMLQIFSVPALVLRGYFVGQKNEQGIRTVLVYIPIIKTVLLGIGLVGWGLWGIVIAGVVGTVIDYVVSFFPLLFKKKELLR